MFNNQKKGSADITPGDPHFMVRYVGKTETYVTSGAGCTLNAVQKIWDNSVEEKYMQRMMVIISSTGICMRDLEGRSKEPSILIDIKDIAYCCAEKAPHERVFTWISKDHASKKLECHAVLCTTKEKAQGLALTLHRAFHIAYKDWKSKKDKRARQKKASKVEQMTREKQANGNNQKKTPSSASSSSSSSSLHLYNGDKHLPDDIQDTSFSSESNDGSHDSRSCGGSQSPEDIFLETAMAQMNLVEEGEVGFQEMVIEPKIVVLNK